MSLFGIQFHGKIYNGSGGTAAVNHSKKSMYCMSDTVRKLLESESESRL